MLLCEWVTPQFPSDVRSGCHVCGRLKLFCAVYVGVGGSVLIRLSMLSVRYELRLKK